MAHLNDKTIRTLPLPASGRNQYADGKVPGLSLWVTCRGNKTFYFKYRFNKAIRRLTIGHFPDMPLAEARSKAHTAIGLLKAGKDPALSPEVVAKATQIPTPVDATTSPDTIAISFSAALDQFQSLYCTVNNRDSTASETMRVLRHSFLTAMPDHLLKQISKPDITGIIDAIVARGKKSAANHAHSNICTFFNWCESRGMVDVNPCYKLKPPAKKRKRDKVLTDQQLSAVWHAANIEGYPFGPIVQLLMLSLQRRGEVSGLLKPEIDDHAAIWAIPGDRTKNGVPQFLPMTPRFRAILASCQRSNGPCIFPSRKDPQKSFTGWSKAKKKLDQTAGFKDWTLHDLRRTGASNMAKLKVPPHIIEKILNHVSETFDGVAGIYNQYEYREEMRDALDIWAAHLKKIVKRHRPNLTPRPDAWQHRIRRPLAVRLATQESRLRRREKLKALAS